MKPELGCIAWPIRSNRRQVQHCSLARRKGVQRGFPTCSKHLFDVECDLKLLPAQRCQDRGRLFRRAQVNFINTMTVYAPHARFGRNDQVHPSLTRSSRSSVGRWQRGPSSGTWPTRSTRFSQGVSTRWSSGLAKATTRVPQTRFVR